MYSGIDGCTINICELKYGLVHLVFELLSYKKKNYKENITSIYLPKIVFYNVDC